MVIITTFLTSCSTDDSFISVDSDKAITLKTGSSENNIAISAFNEILDEYIFRYGKSEKPIEDIIGNVITIAKTNQQFMALQGSGGVLCDMNDINTAIQFPKLYVEELSLSTVSLNEVTTFFEEEVRPETDINSVIYEFTDGINKNSNIAESEKNIILRSCELTLVNSEKDRDWGKTTGLMAASLSGGMESPAQAVLNAVVVTASTF